jgi:hypothetical protein
MSGKLILFTLVAIAVLAVALYFYVGIIRQHLSVANFAVDKTGSIDAARGWFAKLKAWSINLQTIILAAIAAGVQALEALPPEVTSTWKDLPWASYVDARVANWITLACTVLIPLVHARGLARAAVALPADPN